MPGSLTVPELTRSPTSASYSAAEEKASGGPADGQRDHSTDRYDAYPVSEPSKNGEPADGASSTGSQAPTSGSAATASSRSATPTWVCIAQTCCSRPTSAYSATIRSYRR